MIHNELVVYNNGNDDEVAKCIKPGNIYALGLQLIAANIVGIYHVDGKKQLGTDKLNMYVGHQIWHAAQQISVSSIGSINFLGFQL